MFVFALLTVSLLVASARALLFKSDEIELKTPIGSEIGCGGAVRYVAKTKAFPAWQRSTVFGALRFDIVLVQDGWFGDVDVAVLETLGESDFTVRGDDMVTDERTITLPNRVPLSWTMQGEVALGRMPFLLALRVSRATDGKFLSDSNAWAPLTLGDDNLFFTCDDVADDEYRNNAGELVSDKWLVAQSDAAMGRVCPQLRDSTCRPNLASTTSVTEGAEAGWASALAKSTAGVAGTCHSTCPDGHSEVDASPVDECKRGERCCIPQNNRCNLVTASQTNGADFLFHSGTCEEGVDSSSIDNSFDFFFLEPTADAKCRVGEKCVLEGDGYDLSGVQQAYVPPDFKTGREHPGDKVAIAVLRGFDENTSPSAMPVFSDFDQTTYLKRGKDDFLEELTVYVTNIPGRSAAASTCRVLPELLAQFPRTKLVVDKAYFQEIGGALRTGGDKTLGSSASTLTVSAAALLAAALAI